MRRIITSENVRAKMAELQNYLIHDLKLSERAALNRTARLKQFLASRLGSDLADYALCRHRRWHALGYRCVQSGGWVFAYEIVPEGVIVRDMSHGAALRDED